MKRRKTVSVTPAIGAKTVAGAIPTEPICRVAGTGTCGAARPTKVPAPPAPPFEMSQDFLIDPFYFASLIRHTVDLTRKKKSPRREGKGSKTNLRQLLLRRLGLWRFVLGVLPTEALHASSGIEHLLLAGKERVASRANFNADVAD
jgi:hypothetical protein